MHLISVLALSLLPLAAHATVNGHCSGTATGLYLKEGICISTSKCNDYGGQYITGGCPNDPNDIKCCRIDEAIGDGCAPNNAGYSYCTWTANGCSGGSWLNNRCPGGDNYKCCKI
ncbi:hypothetical protein B0H63DRAFT_78561 [Podospora didyma]|uniref:Uncharacterized protein n=1 Tax=Podospora didyma TaxID=330526 RepID=A0AAE0K259_9PEZI|nr:hypothetical protein B0H63DRAFT_78561 [Podospora didyma]